MKHKTIRIFKLITIISLLIASVSDSFIKADAAGTQLGLSPAVPFKLAILVPLTGPIPGFGASARDGALLAIDQQNLSGGILGRTIVPIIEDTACNPAMAVSAAQKVINQDGVQYIIGDVCSSSSIPMSEVTNAAQVIQMAPSASHPDVTIGAGSQVKAYVFRACFTNPYQAVPAARFARSRWSAQKAFTLFNLDSDFSLGLEEAFNTEFSKSASIVGREPYHSSDTDFTAILDKVIDEQPDVIYLPDSTEFANLFTSQAKVKGITIPFIGADSWEWSELFVPSASGSYYTTHFSLEDPRPEVSAFDLAYTSEYGHAPDAIAALAYDSAKLIIQAVQEAGSTDTTLVKTKLEEIAFHGVTGSLTYDSNHNPIKSVPMMAVRQPEGIHFYELIPPNSPGPDLAINFSTGSQGSFFTLTGTDYPPGSSATVTINGLVMAETIAVDEAGGFDFRLSTTQADTGVYFVTVSVNPSASVSFRLTGSSPLRSKVGESVVVAVPDAIAQSNFIYLPVLRR